MKRLHAFAGLTIALLAFHAGSAAAQVYKWTDERGRVTYSNQLPADGKTAEKAKAVEDRVSVYTPDTALTREIAANRQRASRPAVEPPAAPAVAMLGTPSPLPSDAVEPLVYDYPYVVGGGGYWRHRPPRPLHKIPQVKLPPGAIAGNTVGLYSIIPGSSAPVPGTWSPIAPQPPSRHRPVPFKRHSWQR